MWGTGYGSTPLMPSKQDAMDMRFGGKNYAHPHGAPYGMSLQLPFFSYGTSVFRTNRKRINGYAMLWSLFVPWLLFCISAAVCSFRLHYTDVIGCLLIVAFLLFCSTCSYWCLNSIVAMRMERDPETHWLAPGWYAFLCITSVLAILAGTVVGFRNYDANMKTVYDYDSLATYRDIDPAKYVGQQLIDAGLIAFKDKTHLDIKKSMAFKDKEIYCVAPIVSNASSATTYLDFWAVGKGCCSGVSADFHCDGYMSAHAMGGLRLMNEDARPFYRLAVQQAEATYNVTARKPLFFTWTKDPIRYIDDLRQAGTRTYLAGIFTAFCAQGFFVVSATLIFAKIYPSRDASGHH